MIKLTNPKNLTNVVICAIIISMFSIAQTGCIIEKAVYPIPDTTYPMVISYDENGDQTAGLMEFLTEDNKFVLTEKAVNKYNALIEKYGNRFIPELKKNDGVVLYDKDRKLYSIRADCLYNFCKMSKWHQRETNVNQSK